MFVQYMAIDGGGWPLKLPWTWISPDYMGLTSCGSCGSCYQNCVVPEEWIFYFIQFLLSPTQLLLYQDLSPRNIFLGSDALPQLIRG